MKIIPKNLTTAGVGLVLAAGTALGANVIPLVNASFEDDTIGDNSFSDTVPTGWTHWNGQTFIGNGTGDSLATGLNGGHTGPQFYLGHSGGGPAGIYQETGFSWNNVSVGDTLTMTAWTTYRDDLKDNATTTYFWFNDGGGTGLNNGGFNVFLDADGTTPVAAGVWVERTWNLLVTQEIKDQSSEWDALVLQIGFVGGDGNRQVMFDDVSLTHTPVPEPSGIALGGIALGLAVLRRRRRA